MYAWGRLADCVSHRAHTRLVTMMLVSISVKNCAGAAQLGGLRRVFYLLYGKVKDNFLAVSRKSFVAMASCQR